MTRAKEFAQQYKETYEDDWMHQETFGQHPPLKDSPPIKKEPSPIEEDPFTDLCDFGKLTGV